LRIGSAIGRVDQQSRAVAQVEAAAHDQPHPALPGLLVRAHDAGQRIPNGDAECGQPKQLGHGEPFLDMRGPAQEREVRGDLQLGVAGHRPPSFRVRLQRSPEPSWAPPAPGRDGSLADVATESGRFSTTKPLRWRCSTSRSAVMRAMASSAWCTRRRP
jgi:hypothetical protein